jgi:hypothetical protein
VCNYGPSGNLVGTAMYKIGFPGMTACKAVVAFQTPIASWRKFPPNNFDKNKKKMSYSFQVSEDLILSYLIPLFKIAA